MTDIQLMRRAAVIARKSRCWMGMGCVIARKDEILSEGFNETLPGEEYCQAFRDRCSSLRGAKPRGNLGCIRHELGLSGGKESEKVCSIHAEASAVARAAKKGINLNNSRIFITSFPCLVCLRLIIASGIKKIYYMNDFYKPHHPDMLKASNIEFEQIPEKIVWGE